MNSLDIKYDLAKLVDTDYCPWKACRRYDMCNNQLVQ